MSEGLEQAQTEFNVMLRTLNEQAKRLTADYMADFPQMKEYAYHIAVTVPDAKSKGFIMGGDMSEELGLAHLAMAHRSGTTALLGPDAEPTN